ncbi:hypothetical protein M409DRAFT_27185 [Zasmidium cellare ATCC 36951]|uniref:Uncharacterized protein n=1 Tax=Zasmidium cellare ATCC 36951 TaxID=1080233 RepID=A0A6A6C6U4_ZASCE|nr:uncharacterized protein M409DRAFT_27185 [Zasmidium cellare ATCC 36951]KAF2162563.1 hypothetical protein M409DRAFT_27185 [Zasmidium cellare ATCC 36951]
MEVTEHKRRLALERLDKQEQDALAKKERSIAYVAAKTKQYQDAKAALEKAFRADMELKNVVQRNTDRISDRRSKLQAPGDVGVVDELLQPLDLEHVGAPGSPEPPDDLPDPVNRAAIKKGTAKKITASSSKKGATLEDNPEFKSHRKHVPEMDAGGGTTSVRTRRSLRPDNGGMDTSPYAEEQSTGRDSANMDEQEADMDTEQTQGRAQREGSAESVLSHITVADKRSKNATPNGQSEMDFGLPLLPFDEPFGQQFEQTNSQLGTFEDAMDWANQPFVDAPGGELGRSEEGDQGYPTRGDSPSASSATSSSSGLFVSERPRRRRRYSTPRGYRDQSPEVADDRVSPEPCPSSELYARDGESTPLPFPNTAPDQSTPQPMMPPNVPGPGYREDSLFGERMSEPPNSASMDIDQSSAQLPTPDPSRSQRYSREPSEQQPVSPVGSGISTGDSLFVSAGTPEQRVPAYGPAYGQIGGANGQASMGGNTQNAPGQAEGKPAKKKGGRAKSILDSLLSKRR